MFYFAFIKVRASEEIDWFTLKMYNFFSDHKTDVEIYSWHHITRIPMKKSILQNNWPISC